MVRKGRETTGDICDAWVSIVDIGFDRQAGLECYAGPGHWNDPDMLVVGMYGKGNVAHGGCSDSEYRCHFALWCLLASPLMIGCDVRNMNQATRDILLNREAIAVNQDPLGCQARRIGKVLTEHERHEAWAKPLADGSVAVGLFNLSNTLTRTVSVSWESLGIDPRKSCLVRDMWEHSDMGLFTEYYCKLIPPHEMAFLRLVPQG